MANDAQPGRTPSRDVVEAAARWFVQLQDDSANGHTFAAWNQWLAASSEHRLAYEEIENTVLRLKVTSPPPPLPSRAEMDDDSYDGSTPVAEFLSTNMCQSSSARRERFRWRLAAVVLAAIGLGSVMPWLLQRDDHLLEETTYQTPPGQRGFVELSDGSRVTLDADSTLSVRMTPERRLLTLSRGEGYFEVAKQRSRPFVVQAGATQVTALGTAFNVRRSDDRTVVAVVEGKVQVVAGASPVAEHHGAEVHLDAKVPAVGTPRLSAHVSAGEAVSYVDDGNLHALPVTEASLATGWLKGNRRYRNESLRYVLADISRYTGRSIMVADEATGALQFTGTLDLENSGSWLRGLTVALPVTLSLQEDGVLLVTLVKQ